MIPLLGYPKVMTRLILKRRSNMSASVLEKVNPNGGLRRHRDG
jgi:hypothetical protein